MKLISLKMKNFLSIGNVETDFEFKENCITLISGDYGSGKSTLIDAISVCLFGKTFSKKSITKIINWDNKKNCELTLELEHNSNNYIIKRGFKPEFEVIYKNGEEQPITGKDGLNKLIIETFQIDRKIFDQTVFISSKIFKPFLELKSTERYEFITRLFETKRYDDMNEKAKNLRNRFIIEKNKTLLTLENKKEFLDSIKKEIEDETNVVKEKKESIQNEMNLIKEQIIEMKKKETFVADSVIEKLNENILSYTAKISSLRTELKNKEKDIEDFVSSSKIRQTLEENLKAFCESHTIEFSDELYDSIRQELSDLKDEGVKLQNENNIHKLNIQQLEDKNKQFNQKIEDNTIAKEKLSSLVEECERENQLSLEKIVSDTKSKKESLREEMSSLKTNITLLESKINDILEKMKYYTNTKVCDSCQQEINEQFVETKIKSLHEQLIECKEQQKISQDAYNSKQKEFSDISTLNEKTNAKLNEIKILKSKISQMSLTIMSKEEVDGWIDQVNRRVEEIENNRQSIVRNNSRIKEIASLMTVKKSDFDNLSLWVNKKNEILRTQITGHFHSEDVMRSIRETIPMMEFDIKQSRDNLSNILKEKQMNDKLLSEIAILNERYISYEREMTNLKISDRSGTVDKYSKEIEELTTEFENFEKKEKLFTDLCTLTSENGIKKYIVQCYLGMLNEICEKYIKSVESKFHVRFIDKKGLTAEIYFRGEEIDYENLSNGQGQKVNLAVLFTFIEFIRRKKQSAFPLLFLDEMFDNSMNLEAFKMVLSEVKKNIPYVNIISHREATLEMADRIVKVLYDGRFSTYSTEEVK